MHSGFSAVTAIKGTTEEIFLFLTFFAQDALKQYKTFFLF